MEVLIMVLKYHLKKIKLMYCKIYVNYNKTEDSLFKELSDSFGLIKENNYLYYNDIEIYIDYNEEYNFEKSLNFPDGFLHFKYTIDINSVTENITIINVITQLLNFFWSNQYAAIASCDFEDKLPFLGGYNNKNTPWTN